MQHLRHLPSERPPPLRSALRQRRRRSVPLESPPPLAPRPLPRLSVLLPTPLPPRLQVRPPLAAHPLRHSPPLLPRLHSAPPAALLRAASAPPAGLEPPPSRRPSEQPLELPAPLVPPPRQRVALAPPQVASALRRLAALARAALATRPTASARNVNLCRAPRGRCVSSALSQPLPPSTRRIMREPRQSVGIRSANSAHPHLLRCARAGASLQLPFDL